MSLAASLLPFIYVYLYISLYIHLIMVCYGIFPPLTIYYDIMVCKPQDNWNCFFFSGRPNCQAFFFFGKGLEDILSTQAWRAGFWYAGTNSQELLCKRGNGYAHVRLCLKIISVRNYQVQLQQLCACYLPCIIYLFATKPDLAGLTSGRRAGATHPPQLRYGLSWDCPPPKKWWSQLTRIETTNQIG